MDISKNIQFNEICDMLEKVKNTEKPAQKETVLKKYIVSLRNFCDKFSKEYNDETQSSFYCVLRLLVPEMDNARGSYGLQITSMGKIYSKVLHLPPDDALKLQKGVGAGSSMDYADVVYNVIKSRTLQAPGELSVYDINNKLDSIASGARSTTETVLRELLDCSSSVEQKWFIRLLLKRMNLGISSAKILSILHPKAKELYTRCSDLIKVCTAVENGDFICLLETLTPFLFIQPMLCDRLKLKELYAMMGADSLYAETKMDGERFQLHMEGEIFKYYSRNGKDYTKFFGSHHAEGNLTPLLVGLFEPFVKSIILDGEMMVWDKEELIFRTKGENFDVKHLSIGGNLRPCFVAFDLLYLNGKGCIDMGYAERKRKLETCFKEQTGVLQFGKHTKVCTLQHFMDIFNNALDANEEGVVIKTQRSVYKPHCRIGGWYKVKADYIQGLTSDMDMLIMGGYYNRFKKSVESYLVGVIDGKGDEASLHCVGKVALGLSGDERNQLNSTLAAKWKRGIPPKVLHFGNQSPHVWIEPKDSVILQIKASELGQTSSFATPFTLRFPRIEAIRSDKPWDECMTLAEYETFYKGSIGVKKINKRSLDEEDLNGNIQQKKRLPKTNNSTTAYSTTFDSKEINVDSSIFEGFKFCILSAQRGCNTVVDLKKLAVKNGGTIVENPSPTDNMCICIAGDITYRVEKLCETGNYNIVSCNWLLDTAARKRLQLKPRDMISATPEMKEQFKTLFDSNGDSYTDHVDVDELKMLFNDLDEVVLPSLQRHEIAAIEEELFEKNKSPNFFRGCKGFFYNEKDDKIQSHATTLAKMAFQWRGGTCPESSTHGEKKIKYVFVDKTLTDMNALETWFLMSFPTRVLKIQVVSIRWILDSDKEGRKLPTDDYLIKF